jgi:hypothetical protein
MMLRSIADTNKLKALTDHIDSILHPFSLLPFLFLHTITAAMLQVAF